MEEQAAAERARRATVTRAEGDKSAAILQADGRLEASRRDAEAKVVLAEADREAIVKVAEATQGGELPLVFLLGQRYVDAMRKMAENTTPRSSSSPPTCLRQCAASWARWANSSGQLSSPQPEKTRPTPPAAPSPNCTTSRP
jgi:SPFH domain, Band 7 family protein